MDTTPVRLDPAQRAAVEHEEGPLEVLAGPGTGKTLILVERAARLYQGGVSLAGMLLVSFSTRAAGKMRRRLQLRLGVDLDKESLRNVSTIHALAYRVLRARARVDRRASWRIIDEGEAFEMLKKAAVELGVPESLYAPTDLYRRVQAIKGLPDGADPVKDEVVMTVQRRYQEILRARRVWDLADLAPEALRVLRQDEELASLFRGVCRHLLIDEFQDVTLLEYGLLREILSTENLFVVGSPGQSVYGWRNAHYAALSVRLREEFPHLQTITLTRNYRSTAPIAEAAGAVLPGNSQASRTESARGEGPPVRVHKVYDPEAETALVAGLITEHHDERGLPYGEMAVLCREWRQTVPVERAFLARGIPYHLGDRPRFYERPEVREIAAYLWLARAMARDLPAERGGPGALETVLDAPPRGLGPVGLRRLRDGSAHLTWGRLFAGMIDGGRRSPLPQGCRALFDVLADLSHEVERTPPAAMIERVMERSGYRAWITEDLADARQLHAVEALAGEAGEYPTTDSFLEALRAKTRGFSAGAPGDAGVTLCSIHAAKGLEWKVVFVIGLYEGSMPHVMATDGGASQDPDEERRLAHVAFSRAADHLHLTTPLHLPVDGRAVAVTPSRYLPEVQVQVDELP